MEVPYDIPAIWEWVKIGQICTTNIGLTFKPSEVKETGIPVYKANNIKNGKINTLDLAFVSEQTIIKENEWLSQDDILMAVRSGSKQLVGKTAVIQNLNTKTSFGAFMSVIRPINVSSYFMNYFFQSNYFRNQLDEANTTTIFQVTQKMLKEALLPLPPLSEQKRIVEQIERALEKIDTYSESYNKLQELDKTFPDKLKKSILQYAMQGKLVPQDPNDEPVEVLLEKIRAEKQRLFEEGKLKKKDLEETTVTQGDDNSYYNEVPKGWKWLRLKNLVQLHNGTKVVNKKLTYLDAKTLRGLKQAEYREKGNQVYTGDFVILVDGENSGELFTIPVDGYMGSTFKKIYYFSSDSQIYINWFIFSRQELLRNSKTGSAIPHLNKNLFKELIIGLPPISEQHRISAEIIQVFSKINHLV